MAGQAKAEKDVVQKEAQLAAKRLPAGEGGYAKLREQIEAFASKQPEPFAQLYDRLCALTLPLPLPLSPQPEAQLCDRLCANSAARLNEGGDALSRSLSRSLARSLPLSFAFARSLARVAGGADVLLCRLRAQSGGRGDVRAAAAPSEREGEGQGGQGSRGSTQAALPRPRPPARR
jgi:hypothetical protein